MIIVFSDVGTLPRKMKVIKGKSNVDKYCIWNERNLQTMHVGANLIKIEWKKVLEV